MLAHFKEHPPYTGAAPDDDGDFDSMTLAFRQTTGNNSS
jgi:hypothetical protein